MLPSICHLLPTTLHGLHYKRIEMKQTAFAEFDGLGGIDESRSHCAVVRALQACKYRRQDEYHRHYEMAMLVSVTIT